ncbi:MAG: YdiU family protein [Planctomycetaceae bacterium]|nr:YdiU family protein [Planctomycetaceae bacterium]
MSSNPDSFGWCFENTYTQLPSEFFAVAEPVKVADAKLVVANHRLALELGLRLNDQPAGHLAALFAGQQIPVGAKPIAQAYAGHQFGGFTILGDGRAILLGEHRTPLGERIDIQLKGSGQTPYSRRGDGRAALGPMLREYIISEAMHGLKIPTTQSLAVVTTGETVYRETPLRGAILTRVAASHIRVGTFQFAASRQDESSLRALADYTIHRHYPEISKSDCTDAERYLQFLRAVADRQAALIAQWQMAGFIHGVMNTDNMAISGETIDYGPCAFMDHYDPATVFSSIDRRGRYAYGNQPAIGQWNLARFAETLLPLLDADEAISVEKATAALDEYAERFDSYWLQGMRRKLGLQAELDEDRELVNQLLEWMKSVKADLTNTFDDLSTGRASESFGGLYAEATFVNWCARWNDRLKVDGNTRESVRQGMLAVNPARIARNHRVEEALSAATERDDLSTMHRLLDALASPFDRDPQFDVYRDPSPPGTCYRTFCGT